MYSVRTTRQHIIDAVERGVYYGFGFNFDLDKYTTYSEPGGFVISAPARIIRDLIEDHEDVYIVVAAPGDRPYLYPHPGITILVIPEEHIVFGPLDANGQRTSVYVK